MLFGGQKKTIAWLHPHPYQSLEKTDQCAFQGNRSISKSFKLTQNSRCRKIQNFEFSSGLSYNTVKTRNAVHQYCLPQHLQFSSFLLIFLDNYSTNRISKWTWLEIWNRLTRNEDNLIFSIEKCFSKKILRFHSNWTSEDTKNDQCSHWQTLITINFE